MEKNVKRRRGVRLRVLNIVLIAAACVLTVLLIFFIFKTVSTYRTMQAATTEYLTCLKSADDMQYGSDYMTAEARSFAVTGDRSHLVNYFHEVNIVRHRETSVEKLQQYLEESDMTHYLEDVLKLSNRLMELECYAMVLTAEAKGIPAEFLPNELRRITLSEADAALSAEEKAERATDLLFDMTYAEQKQKINEDVTSALDSLLRSSELRQHQSSDRLLRLITTQVVLIGALLLISLFAVVLASRLLISPIIHSTKCIENSQKIPVRGSAEMRVLTAGYNEMFELTQKKQKQLTYEASHDPLSGLYNRGVFTRVMEELSEARRSDVAMLLVDLDRFKQINDQYGHETGDRVIQKTATQLKLQFRSGDYVCRIGGDEFAVIMTGVTSSFDGLVRRKAAALAEALTVPEDGMPLISLSIGVCFGDSAGENYDLYKNADAALYHTKQSGRDGIAFYHEILKSESKE